MSIKMQWGIWLIATALLAGYFIYCMYSQPSTAARTFLPGVTTHGHYQIELQCKECHTPGNGVLRDACMGCHGEELKRVTDTHPRSKFTDPGKAHLVRRLDGRTCITCHQEHVPDRTLAMGLSLPSDYCWFCHQDIGDQRPSHKDFAYDSCATAGCHNYHDNRGLFEKFLVDHYGEPDVLDEPSVPQRMSIVEQALGGSVARVEKQFLKDDHDAPEGVAFDETLLQDWTETAHAAAGVNCTDCHLDGDQAWTDALLQETCTHCHEPQAEGFMAGRHGMRLAVGLSPMTPGMARLPMNHENLHKQLTCTACHGSHRFDTTWAAVDGCLQCHDDAHSRAYKDSSHFALWEDEVAGSGEPGSGVSCATCHMPRDEDSEGRVLVQHNQNDNLRPNEKMVRTVCLHCHGLQFALDALADPDLIASNCAEGPSGRVSSIDLAKAWADERTRMRKQRLAEKEKPQEPAGKK